MQFNTMRASRKGIMINVLSLCPQKERPGLMKEIKNALVVESKEDYNSNM